MQRPPIPFLAMSEERSDNEDDNAMAEYISKNSSPDQPGTDSLIDDELAHRQLLFNMKLLL